MKQFSWPVARFEIKGLFNERNLAIEFPDDRRIYFLYGDNGVGKTTAMSILEAILNLREEDLITIEFESATVSFKNGSTLRVQSKTEEIAVMARPGLSSRIKDSIEVPVVDFQFRRTDREDFASIAKKELSRWSFPGFTDIDEIEYFKEMANKIILSKNLDRTAVMPLTRWLREKYVEEESVAEDQRTIGFLSEIPTRSTLIRADRLQKEVVVGHRRVYRSSMAERGLSSTTLESSIEINSKKMKSLISHDIQQSFNVSTEVDRDFPEKVIKVLEYGNKLIHVDFDDLIREVVELQRKISQAGIFVKSSSELYDYINIEDTLTRSVVSLFYQGTLKKLQGLELLANKINLFKELVNSKIAGKSLDVNLEGYEVRNRRGKLLALDSLSSGEQHQIVLLFDLIFSGDQGNILYLIDEPELSLHVSWQEQFASDLELISALNGGSFLLATHSPVIVNENWDAMVSFQLELLDQ
jgi:predicted ATP-binding protein involved in virulence